MQLDRTSRSTFFSTYNFVRKYGGCNTGAHDIGARLLRICSISCIALRVLFVSVDTERDTPERATGYAAFFHPRITGVSGSAQAVDAVAKQYYVLYQKVEDPGSALGYTVDHSATTYLIGPKGNVRQLLKHDSTVDEMTDAVRTVLAG